MDYLHSMRPDLVVLESQTLTFNAQRKHFPTAPQCTLQPANHNVPRMAVRAQEEQDAHVTSGFNGG